MSEQSNEPRVERVSRFDELYKGRFIKGSLINGKLTLTIAKVWNEEMEGEKGKKFRPVLAFREIEEQHAMPKINGVCLRDMFGADVRAWVGKRVTFFGTDRLMPMANAKGTDRIAVRVFGSPDIASPVNVTYSPPRRRPIKMTMQPTGKAPATDSGNLSGDALRAAQGKVHAMTNACARQLGSTPEAYYAAVKQSAGIATGKEMTQAQVDLACSHLRDYIDGREPPL